MAKGDKRAGRIISGLPRKVKLAIAGACAVIIIVAIVVGVPVIQSKLNKTTYLTASQLTEIVNVSKLSTAEYRYNGIADKYNDKGEAEYHVYYESTISASYDIDEEAKTITPHLPEPEIGDPSIDTTALDYLPKKPNANLKDVISVCKADALAEVTSAGGILYTANQNMRRTMEALLMPVTEKTGYSLVWPDDESSRQNDAADDQSEEQEEDGSYE